MKRILAVALSALMLLTVPYNAFANGVDVSDDITVDNMSKTTTDMLTDFISNEEVVQAIVFKNVPLIANFSGLDKFKELVARDDLLDALESYAEYLSQPDYIPPALDQEAQIFADLLGQWTIIDTANAAVISDSSQYPNLQRMYSSHGVDLTSTTAQIFTVNGIRYTRAGSVQTAGGKSVDGYTPARQLTDTQIRNLNAQGDAISGATRVGNPAADYNCHSYAWYKQSTSNPFWILDEEIFESDSECTYIGTGPTSTSAQVNDTIVYYDGSGNAIHSGIITAVTSDGVLTIKSKWGQGGIYVHSVNAVPSSYRPQGSSTTRTKIYRYHDYKYQYTGQNYHQGSRHYFQYATKCTVCFAQKGEAVWKFKACSGSPCVLPASVPDMAS